jgi:hypothetical protein
MSVDLDTDLRLTQKRYTIATVIFALLTVSAIVLHKYDVGCLATVKSLQTAKKNLRLMRDTSASITATLRNLQTLFPADRARLSAEQLLFGKIDDIKLRFRDADMTIGNIETQSSYLAITFALKGVVQNYPLFLDAVGEMERTVLPVVQIKTLNLSQAEVDHTPSITYQVDGLLKFPVAGTAEQPPQK